jgi:hypothetical protein
VIVSSQSCLSPVIANVISLSQSERGKPIDKYQTIQKLTSKCFSTDRNSMYLPELTLVKVGEWLFYSNSVKTCLAA